MGRYKALIGPRLRARGFATQQTEAAISVAVLESDAGGRAPEICPSPAGHRIAAQNWRQIARLPASAPTPCGYRGRSIVPVQRRWPDLAGTVGVAPARHGAGLATRSGRHVPALGLARPRESTAHVHRHISRGCVSHRRWRRELSGLSCIGLTLKMVHDRVGAIDADLRIGSFAIPQPPVLAFNFLDDHCLRRLKPVENRRRGDTRAGENVPKSRTAVRESGQLGLPGASDRVEVPVDQNFDGRSGSDHRAKTCRPPDAVSTLPTRTSRWRSSCSQLRMKVESRVTTTADVATSGRVMAHSPSASPTFRA
jgi:hypothetical protein